jgi:pyruvate,water dikinase
MGTARIAHSPQEAAHVQRGEILVARSTDPGWTPAFALASGLVLEVGGQLSHGAIVAREYGLPAVVNVRDALHRIEPGQTITVDGTVGAVYLEG